MARRDDKDDDETPTRSARGSDRSSARTGSTRGGSKSEAEHTVSLDDEDAIDGGTLFGSGEAEIIGSSFEPFDYGGNMRKPAIVWLITYQRGEGKEKETYDQPYGIGNGWDLSKSGALVPLNGQTGLSKSCNAMRHLVKPLKKVLAEADIEPPTLRDPHVLEGLRGEVERVDQEDRNIQEKGRRPGRGQSEQKRSDGPKTILEISAVEFAPWVEESGNGKGPKKSLKEHTTRDAKADADDDEEPAPRRGRAGRAAEPEPEPADDDKSLEEEAVEALVEAVSSGKCKVGEPLEIRLEKVLGKRKDAPDIIDLATSPKFLKKENGWVLSKDGKTIDAEA